MHVINSKKTLVFTPEDAKEVMKYIPHAKVFEHNGHEMVAVPHGVEETLVLRNMGLQNPPAPIMNYYHWPARFKPMQHQKGTSAFLTMNKQALCLNSPGTGKSLSALWAADFLLDMGVVSKVLIVAPLSVLTVVWGKELKHHMLHRTFNIVTGTPEKKRALLKEPVDFLIINHDGFTNLAAHISDVDLVIYDEATAVKNPSATRYRVLQKWINQHNPWLWLLTGTPISQSPTDAWTLAKLVQSQTVPRSYTAFKDLVMRKVSTFTWVPRDNAIEVCKKVLQPSIRFSLDECIDLPETSYIGRETQLTHQQARAFTDMQKTAVAVFAQGDVVAANAAIVLSKLLQIACLAYNTEVLTEEGWLPIQLVNPKQKIWDGEEWVSQDGVVYRGDKNTVELDGVMMTPDHKVWVNEWRTAEEIIYGDDSGRFSRPEVRLPNGTTARARTKDANKNSEMAMSVRLRECCRATKPVFAKCGSQISKELRLPPWQRNAQAIESSAIQYMERNAKKMQQRFGQRFQKLWGAWNNCLRRVAELLHSVLARHGRWVSRQLDARSYRCQRELQQTELPMGGYSHAKQQYSRECLAGYPQRKTNVNAGCANVWAQACYTSSKTPQVRMAPTTGFDRTYDLVNCGPRNRFVVRGKEGKLLIVHNCGAAYDAGGKTVTIPSQPRIDALEELIAEVGDKVIVFVPFRGVQDMLEQALIKAGHDVASVHGDVSKGERNKIFDAFQNTEKIRVLLAHPKVAAHGLTLTRAPAVIWYAPIYSLEQYEQANARIKRLTTKGKTSIFHLYATSFERELYRRLQLKKKVLADFLDLVRGINDE